MSKSLDFHIHARRKIELHQRIHRVRRGLENIVVGKGIGPATSAPVRFAVSTISLVDWSRIL